MYKVSITLHRRGSVIQVNLANFAMQKRGRKGWQSYFLCDRKNLQTNYNLYSVIAFTDGQDIEMYAPKTKY
jgi:hypothetical protein